MTCVEGTAAPPIERAGTGLRAADLKTRDRPFDLAIVSKLTVVSKMRTSSSCFGWVTSLPFLTSVALFGCGGSSSEESPTPKNEVGRKPGIVEVVLFTHIEDGTPQGALGSAPSQKGYLELRAKLIETATLAKARKLSWVLQSDWKYLEAALVYEDAALKATTNGKNLFVHLRDDLGVALDPHSHEKGGYNYADVAYLLEKLGVGGSTVIGGHIWDPSLPEFAEWDRFRQPLAGQKYPTALWSGDILIGAGTPNHVNDPRVSGAWHPADRNHFFEDEPTGNVRAFGQWENGVTGVAELVGLYANGTVPTTTLLTASWNIGPGELTAKDGPATIDTTVFAPLAALRDQGVVHSTDFTSLVKTWQTEFGGVAGIYMP